MRYDTGHKERTRERILDEAARAIRDEGPHQIAVAGLMARAGLTHGGFYAHFPSKDALVAAAITRMFDEVGDKLGREIEGRSPAEGLRNYINFYVSRSHRENRATGCPLPALSADLPRLTDEARAAFGEGLAKLTDRVEAILTAMGRKDAATEASSMISEMMGAIALARATADETQSDAILLRTRHSLRQRFGVE